MSYPIRIAGALVVVGLLLAGAVAQAGSLPAVGTRVRLHLRSGLDATTVSGVIVASDSDLVRIWDGPASPTYRFPNGRPVDIPEGREILIMRERIRSIDISVGRHSRVAAGLGIGLLAGTSFGVLAGLAGGDDPPGFFAFSAGEKAALGALTLGFIGAVIGAVAGASSQVDTWQPCSEAAPRVQGVLGPAEGGATPGVTLRF